jgi:hypothetical protein
LATCVVAGVAWRAAHRARSATPTRSPLVSMAPLSPAASTDLATFPSAANTGVPAGTHLIAVPGDRKSGPGWRWNGVAVQVTGADTTLAGLDINGAVRNSYSGLVVRDTRIRCTNENDWCVSLGAHSLVMDTEIGGGANGMTYGHAIGLWSGGSEAGNVIERVNIHHLIGDLRIDGGTTVADSYIHDLVMGDPVVDLATGAVSTDNHSGGLMTTRGSNTVIRHNRFEGGNTANLFVQRDVTDTTQRIGSYLIENNLFVNVHKNDSDSSFGIDIEDKGIVGPIVARNNTFTRLGWTVGPVSLPPGSTATGNVYTDGTPIS